MLSSFLPHLSLPPSTHTLAHATPTGATRPLRLLAWAALLGAAGLLGGCSTFVKAKFNRGEGIAEEDSVLVVPFGEPGRNLWYGESRRGVSVAEAIKGWARQNWSPNLPEDEDTERILKQVRDWTARSISPLQWKALTNLSGIRYVVYGEIKTLETNKPTSVGFYEPRVEALYRVVDVSSAKPRVVYQPQTPIIIDTIEEEDRLDMPIMETGRQEEAVERKILAKLGTQIGQELYGYYKE